MTVKTVLYAVERKTGARDPMKQPPIQKMMPPPKVEARLSVDESIKSSSTAEEERVNVAAGCSGRQTSIEIRTYQFKVRRSGSNADFVTPNLKNHISLIVAKRDTCVLAVMFILENGLPLYAVFCTSTSLLSRIEEHREGSREELCNSA